MAASRCFIYLYITDQKDLDILISMKMIVCGYCWWFLVVLLAAGGQGQQSYVNNHQLDCYNTAFNSTTKGYICNLIAQSSCRSYLTFRSNPPYTSPSTIAHLLAAQNSLPLIASINNISSDVPSIPINSQLVVPVNCSCYGARYYQHNATYTLINSSETYFTVANNTYQGLTTCQALMDQNPFPSTNLTVGLHLQVPLRCACPSPNQTSSGVKYLLTYMVTWGDSLSSIAQLFGVQQQSILDANNLTSSSIIYPFTPILVPLSAEPTKIQPYAAPSPPPLPPVIPVGPGEPNSSTNDSRKWVFVGIAIGAAFIIILAISGFLFWNRQKAKPVSIPQPDKLQSEESADYAPLPVPDSKSWSLSSNDVQYAIGSLTVYKFHDLQIATECFSQANRIKGSVYRGSFKGDTAAVKVVKGDVSNEINVLKKINHSNVIRLSGFCSHEGNTYLVYEYAENGSLSDCLHAHKNLAWKQRVQIAYDVADALNYLHNYTNPPYIHKNLKTSNILLDANFRAKIANFGLARMLEKNEDDGGLQLTRHVVGTQGYMAPEYIENGVITPKLDVFAFGIVMLKLLSAKEAAGAGDRNPGNELLSAMIDQVLEGENVRNKLRGFIDPSLRDEYPLDVAFSMTQLAKSCVAHDLNARPSMSEVFMTLSKILSSSLDWDPSLELRHSGSLTQGR